MRPLVTTRSALGDAALLGKIIPGDSWRPWRVLLIAMMGEPLTHDERLIFQKLTSREREPGVRCEELWAVVGRRAGKTRAAAVLSVYISAFCEHEALALGERGLCLFLAQNQRQAAVAFRHAQAILESVPMLRSLIANTTVDTIALTTGIDLEIRAASFRGLRGVTAVAVIADEAAFWFANEQSSNPDSEILNAVRPALATTQGPLIVISSPYAKRGEVYAAFKRHYGSTGDPRILVAQAASRDLNPTLPQSVVDRAMERDAAAASAEYLGLFRSDLEAFVSIEIVEAAIEWGVYERAPADAMQYFGFVDPSGGASDAMTLAIAHAQDRVPTLDAVRECKPPFSPEAVVAEFAELLRRYRISSISGDRYAGEWPREAFARHGIAYVIAEKSRSELYVELLPALNSKTVALLDNQRLVAQLTSLERRTGRGKDVIDHPIGQHDDVANAVAGALHLCSMPDASVWAPLIHAWAEPTVSDEDDDPANRLPWHPAKQVAKGEMAASGRDGRALIDLYFESYRRFSDPNGLRSVEENDRCASCGLPLGTTKTTDGIATWHPTCQPPGSGARTVARELPHVPPSAPAVAAATGGAGQSSPALPVDQLDDTSIR